MCRHWPLCIALLFPVQALAFDLDDLQDRLHDIPGLAGQFEQQRYLADLDTRLDSQGRFRYVRDERIVWSIESPVEDRLEFTPDSVSNLADQDNNDTRENQVASLFLQLLEGDWQALDAHFDLDLNGNANQWRVTLTPDSDALRGRIVSIELKGAEFLERLELHAANEDVLQVDFSHQHVIETSHADGDEAGHVDDA
ncbi:LolA family protein [Aidingimonas lacisalsi]|uniref:LolA family protein n=1 Tax=Aidingimonas lacisalsi TaxID=2604086 RepID=UPI0011D19992|nr:outer membrane lipoprotein carrier protein LolA [Aidingimonas lacisalsi]